jgi:hypothetical protein
MLGCCMLAAACLLLHVCRCMFDAAWNCHSGSMRHAARGSLLLLMLLYIFQQPQQQLCHTCQPI